jgi:hypothetical protein
MRHVRPFVICAAAAFISAGCEVHSGPDRVAVSGGADVSVEEPQGAVVQGPGVEEVDVDPDPAQRTYIYDEGYPPGTYTYNGYYYYGGYRYPHDVFVNQYVQENIRQHRYVDAGDNRKQGLQIEQRNRTEFAQTHGVRKNRPAAQGGQPREQAPARQPEAPARQPDVRPNVEQNRVPTNEEKRPAVEQPQNRTPANEERRPAVEQPQNRVPANEERRPAVEQPQNKTPGNDANRSPEARPDNKANPANEEHRPAGDEPKRDDAK